ncbi:MAG: hypothetical protein HC854_09610 [Flavobacterium sp.]|nr:hypothetical protein [Flavobacterium sp.]
MTAIFEFIIESLSLVMDFLSLKDSKKDTISKKSHNKHNVKIALYVLSIGSLILISFLLYKNYYGNEKRAIEKLVAIEKILASEKEDIGTYPENLSEIIRNNPLRKDIIIDVWGNEYYYEQLDKGQNYKLCSKGKDGVLNTIDDVKID